MSESKVNDSIRPDNKLFKNVRLTRLIFGQLMEYKPLGHRNIIIVERMKIIYYESSESWKIYVELFLSEYSLPLRKDPIRRSHDLRVGCTYAQYSAL